MKLLRVGKKGNEKPAAIDQDGKIRDISSHVKDLNPESIETISECKVEECILEAKSEEVLQFERIGYFCLDSKVSHHDARVFNRTVTLRDTWAKMEEEQKRKH